MNIEKSTPADEGTPRCHSFPTEMLGVDKKAFFCHKSFGWKISFFRWKVPRILAEQKGCFKSTTKSDHTEISGFYVVLKRYFLAPNWKWTIYANIDFETD
jgi:hypothetical protein